MEELTVGDKVELKSKHIGTIININEFREPSMKYGIDIEGFSDVVFVGEEAIIRKVKNESYYDFQKELQQLKEENYYLRKNNIFLQRENNHLSVVRHEHENYIENIHLIPERMIKSIEKNTYKFEVSEGKFVDIKELYLELETYKKIAEEIEKMFTEECVRLGSYEKDNSIPEKERIAGGVNILNKLRKRLDWARKEVEKDE